MEWEMYRTESGIRYFGGDENLLYLNYGED